MPTKLVEAQFGHRTFQREVTLGVLATDAYFVDTAREEIADDNASLPRFRRGVVLEEIRP